MGVSITIIHTALAEERNGLEITPITEPDHLNLYAKERKLKIIMEGGDENAMVNYLKKMTSYNEYFFML